MRTFKSTPRARNGKRAVSPLPHPKAITETVSYPIPAGLHYRLKEEALAEGKTAAALMTELLEVAVTERQRERYPSLRPAGTSAASSARKRLVGRPHRACVGETQDRTRDFARSSCGQQRSILPRTAMREGNQLNSWRSYERDRSQ